jgi:hypothetical protein
MITLQSITNGIPCVSPGVKQCLVHYVKSYGHIISLDRWAHEWELNPTHVRRCAHAAAKEGLVKLTRLQNASGRPYEVSSLEERHHENN